MEKKTRSVRWVAVFVVALLATPAMVYLAAPDFERLRQSVQVAGFGPDGSAFEREVGPAAADWVPFSKISRYVVLAVVAAEDTTFFSHDGLDFFEIQESIKKDLKEKRLARGGSTLTQQVVKNAFLGPQKSFWRKFKEMIWAYRLERVLTKQEILTFYLNAIEWGPGIYGVGQAAHHYFGVGPQSLSPRQAAFLAVLIPNPGKRYSYFRQKHLTPWAHRQVDRVLGVMHRMQFLESPLFQAALADRLWAEAPVGETVGEQEGSLDTPDNPQSDPLLEPGVEGDGDRQAVPPTPPSE